MRKTHFIASIVVFLTLLMYAFSGLVMTQYTWIHEGTFTSDTIVYALNYRPDTADLHKLAKELKIQFEITGRTAFKRNSDTSITFNITRPGYFYTIQVHKELDSVGIIRQKNTSFFEINKRLHRLHGFQGGWHYAAWAILLDVTGLASIIFAITGILIWLRNHKLFRLGWLFFIPPLLLVIIMMIYLY